MDIEKTAAANAHIPTSEIEKDIIETKQEIAQMEEEARHLEETPLSLRSARLDHMRAESRRNGIKERQKFVDNLKAILQYRRKDGLS